LGDYQMQAKGKRRKAESHQPAFLQKGRKSLLFNPAGGTRLLLWRIASLLVENP
jgi:hypothetical protein